MAAATRLLLVIACLIAWSVPANAHKPSYGGMDVYGAAEEAYVVEDFDVSIVVYHEVTCRSEQLWLEYEAPEDDAELYVQLGVPVIDRLGDYRPSVAVLAPGLPAPEEELPFALPDGFGAMVMHTDEVGEPGAFYEPFSQTDSWILVEETLSVPAGVGYVVAWHPGRETGKLWVATGTVEDFGPEDFGEFGSWMTLTKTFHEVDPYAPIDATTETVCDDGGLDLPAQQNRDAAGCDFVPLGSASPWALIGLVSALRLVGVRRRRS